MKGRYGSLYDSYRLSNSSAIPLFTGSTAPEALQVGQYTQGIYDQSKSGADSLYENANDITSLPQDKALADELRTRTQDKLNEFAQRKDYENLLPDVTRMGREFGSRYRDLVTPIAQRQKYVEGLDNKDLNLTSDQKRLFTELSDQGYKGLQKGPGGKYTGTYSGLSADKNIDVNKFVDDAMKNFATQKGGTITQGSNGQYLIKSGNKFEKLSDKDIEGALQSAMNNSEEYQAYKGMMGKLHGYQRSKSWTNPDNFDDTITTKQNGKIVSLPNTNKVAITGMAKKYGISTQAAAQEYFSNMIPHSIDSDAMNYAKTKYHVNDHFTEQSAEADPYALKAYDPKDNPLGAVDLVTGQGINVGNRYGTADELENKLAESQKSVTATGTYLNSQRARVSKALGKPNVTDNDVVDWLSKNDNQEIGKYQTNLSNLGSQQQGITEMNQVQDAARDAAVKKATGNQYTFDQLKQKATDDLSKLVGNKEIPAISVGRGFTLEGMAGTKTLKINKSNISNFEVVGNGEVRDKTDGRTYQIQGENNKVGSAFEKVGNWKDSYKEGLNGLNSNSTWLTLPRASQDENGKIVKSTLSNRVEDVLRASSGALSIKDETNQDLGQKDSDKVKALITAGKFDALGIGRDPNTGQRRVKLSVVIDPTADDPRDKYRTVMAGADSNIFDRIASTVQEEGQRSTQSTNEPARAAGLKALQFSHALKSGSAYETIPKLLPGQKVSFKNSEGNEYRVIPNLTGDGSNAKKYQVLQKGEDGNWKLATKGGVPLNITDDLDITTLAEMLKADGYKMSQE